ncbi:MAG: type I restriction-modification system subunit M N-terminal domain-containing protein [Verrucomicrobia bacterium]|nr:type I restriction-modification system subunit M N-terminal domain-containing protein [Verrucomicrobiota bacterium]
MPKSSKVAPRKAKPGKNKSLESWIWDAACSIRGAKDAPKYKDFILPLIFTKRLCDVFDDELNRIAAEVGSRKKAFQLAKSDHKLVRFYLPLMPDDHEQPVWSVIRKISDKIGEGVTSHMRAIAKENQGLQGIIDRVDFNATTHGQRDIDDDRLSNLIEAISTKRLGLEDVEADIIGKSYEYLPENLFYNTSAPGIVLFLHAAKPKNRKGKVFLVNASQIFEKGSPKNFIPDAGIQRIADILIGWKEEEKLSRIVDHAELKKNDYNISPSRYIHTSDAETYRPIAEIVAELDAIEAEAKETDKALRIILKQLGV